MNTQPTPETDSCEKEWSETTCNGLVPADFARKLERERNEAILTKNDEGARWQIIATKAEIERDQLKQDIAEIRRQHQHEANEWKTEDELECELTQLRKVADELARHVEGTVEMESGYSSLPHVKTKGQTQ